MTHPYHKPGAKVWSQEDIDFRREMKEARGSAERSPQPVRRSTPDDPWAHLTMTCPDPPPGVWAWLRQALRDIGYPVSGWSFGRDDDSRLEVTMKGDPALLIAEIIGLWDNERPGRPLSVARSHP